MKKAIILSLIMTITAGTVFAANTSTSTTTQKANKTGQTQSQSKVLKLKKLADEYTSISIGESSGSTQKILNEMGGLGAENFNIITYSPCPYRGNIKIGGKSVYAKNRKCAELKYKYKNKDYAVGKCGKPVR